MAFTKRKLLQNLVALCSLCALLNIMTWNSVDIGRKLIVDDDWCALEPPKETPEGIIPVFAASYPGSGSKMTWNLIEALTGYWTGDDWFLNGRTSENVVSIKTHYPHPEGRLVHLETRIQRALLLIRHPMDAIPSYHNYLHEMENGLPPHSLRAPVDEWIPWRDLHFKEELMMWKESIIYWMDTFPAKDRLVMFFENVIDEKTGPLEALRLSEYLGRVENVDTVGEGRAECIWNAIIKYNEIDPERKKAEYSTLGRRKLGDWVRRPYYMRGLKPHSPKPSVATKDVQIASSEAESETRELVPFPQIDHAKLPKQFFGSNEVQGSIPDKEAGSISGNDSEAPPPPEQQQQEQQQQLETPIMDEGPELIGAQTTSNEGIGSNDGMVTDFSTTSEQQAIEAPISHKDDTVEEFSTQRAETYIILQESNAENPIKVSSIPEQQQIEAPIPDEGDAIEQFAMQTVEAYPQDPSLPMDGVQSDTSNSQAEPINDAYIEASPPVEELKQLETHMLQESPPEILTEVSLTPEQEQIKAYMPYIILQESNAENPIKMSSIPEQQQIEAPIPDEGDPVEQFATQTAEAYHQDLTLVTDVVEDDTSNSRAEPMNEMQTDVSPSVEEQRQLETLIPDTHLRIVAEVSSTPEQQRILDENYPAEKPYIYRPYPASHRVGPRVKPFTSEQCQLVLDVLTELKNRYNGMFGEYMRRVSNYCR